MIQLLNIVYALAAFAMLLLAGQFLVRLMSFGRHEENAVYRLFRLLTSPVVRIARIITRLTGSVAFTVSFPVEVLMKSAPAIMQTRLARATLRSVPSSPVAKIALTCASPQAARISRISSAVRWKRSAAAVSRPTAKLVAVTQSCFCAYAWAMPSR